MHKKVFYMFCTLILIGCGGKMSHSKINHTHTNTPQTDTYTDQTTTIEEESNSSATTTPDMYIRTEVETLKDSDNPRYDRNNTRDGSYQEEEIFNGAEPATMTSEHVDIGLTETTATRNKEQEVVTVRNPNDPIPRKGLYLPSDLEEVKYLKVVNYVRSIARRCGNHGDYSVAPKLVLHQALSKAALEHSVDMATVKFFDHYGSGTKSDITGTRLGGKSKFSERIKENHYLGYQLIAENIAYGFHSIEDTIEGWIKSSGHCANLMNPSFTEMGIAKADKGELVYWTQEFGVRY